MHPEKTIRIKTSHYNGDKYINPPVGLRPKWVVADERLQEIVEAIRRYQNAKMAIPPEWFEEYNELSEYLRNR